jgi:hypothetical protein
LLYGQKKNSWTCPEIFRSIGKKRLPGSNGINQLNTKEANIKAKV